jgi:hypothetical protein
MTPNQRFNKDVHVPWWSKHSCMPVASRPKAVRAGEKRDTREGVRHITREQWFQKSIDGWSNTERERVEVFHTSFTKNIADFSENFLKNE